MLVAHDGGAGRDCQGSMQQETLGDRPWREPPRRLSSLIGGSGASGAVRQEMEGRAIVPGHHSTDSPRANAEEDAG